MDAITIQIKVEDAITELEKLRLSIRKYAETKATKIAEYEKSLALTILKLQNEQIKEFEGVPIPKVTATNVEKIARGLCWHQKMQADLAETQYKGLITAIDCRKAELNGYQSIYKYSEYSTK